MKTLKIFVALVLITAVFYSCQKEEDDTAPVLATTDVTNITQITAISGGNISSDGGATITERGVSWNTAENPTISDNKTEDGTGSGEFSSNITGLTPNTTYYVRAYATNSAGTGYGEAISITTQSISFGSFTDTRDGTVYKTVAIGNQEWMAENLAYASSGNYWAYDNDNSNVETYGYLYDWQTALTVCPTGWHLPSDAEWTELTDYLGGESVAGGKLKATGTIEAGTGLWHDPNTGATNETGFTALPGGIRRGNGAFDWIGEYGFWWSATEDDTNGAWYRFVDYYFGDVGRNSDDYKNHGYSVRCLKDE